MIGSRYLAIAVVITTMIAALPAVSEIVLRFSPTDQHIEVGEVGSLSVVLDDAIEVRTVELFVSYDATMVTSLGGEPGQLYSEAGCSLFPFFDEDEPGAWYGGSVTMGPDCFVTGPGELYRWNFEGLANGICHVQVDSVVLYDPPADIIEGVTLEGTTILIGIVSSVDTPSAQNLTLALAPNPFHQLRRPTGRERHGRGLRPEGTASGHALEGNTRSATGCRAMGRHRFSGTCRTRRSIPVPYLRPRGSTNHQEGNPAEVNRQRPGRRP